MDVEKQPSLEDWSDFAGEYIKAEWIKEFPAKLVVVSLDGEYDGTRPKIIANVEYNGRAWKFDLNKTNQSFIKAVPLNPVELIGKVLVVDKIKVRNPTTAAMVDSLVITMVEK